MGDGTRRYRYQNHWLVPTLALSYIVCPQPFFLTWLHAYLPFLSKIWQAEFAPRGPCPVKFALLTKLKLSQFKPLYLNHDVQTTLPWQSVYVWEILNNCLTISLGLAPDTRSEDVSKFFDGYGRIVDVRVMTGAWSQTSKISKVPSLHLGFGFVEFENPKVGQAYRNVQIGQPILW